MTEHEGGPLPAGILAAVAVFLAAAAAGCSPEADEPGIVRLEPVASSEAPLSENTDVALVTETVACVVDSYNIQIQCGDRSGLVVGAFGREGAGPGEFREPAVVERGPGETVAVVDVELARLTLFEFSGAYVSDTSIPAAFTGHKLSGGRLFGVDFLTFYESGRTGGPIDAGIAEVDVVSGEVVWKRSGIGNMVETECGAVGTGWPRPGGGYVFWACDRELIFLDHRDALTAAVVVSPTYFEELPSERDVDAYRDSFVSLSRTMPLSKATVESYVARFRERPKRWLLVGGESSGSPFGFDNQDRLWVATTRDRDAFSYFDVWIGADYAGTVSIRERLLGFDLLGSTLVALVERRPGPDGIALRAIDWYQIDGLQLGS